MAESPSAKAMSPTASVYHHASVKDLSPGEKKMLHEKFGFMEAGFTIGVVSYTINVFLLSRFPAWFWVWHLFKACTHLPVRAVRFGRRNWELYMLDFCYVNTYLTAVGCLLAFIRITTGFESPLHQYNYELLRGGFAFANGALGLSIVMFNNKLVFHDTDNTTSVFIHLSPALFFWTLRWGGGFGTSLIENTWPNMFDVCKNMEEGDRAVQSLRQALWYSGPCQATWTEFITYPAVTFIIIWGIPYYLAVFCCLKGWIQRNGKATLYDDTINDKGFKGKTLMKVPERFRPLAFMSGHFLFTTTSGFLSAVLWNSFVLHTLFLCAVMGIAIHNGSTFMFRVVAARHVQGLVDEVATSPKSAPSPPSKTSVPEDRERLLDSAPSDCETGKLDASEQGQKQKATTEQGQKATTEQGEKATTKSKP